MPEDKPAGIILLIHGLADHGGRFDHVGRFFAEKGFLFIAPDLRGNGKSSGRRGHFESMLQVHEDIRFFLKTIRTQLDGIPAFLYGQSMGGNLVLNYALNPQYKLAGIISSSPWLRLAYPPNPIARGIGTVLSRLFPGMIISNGINPNDLCHDQDVNNRYKNDPLVHGRISLNTFRIVEASGREIISKASLLKMPVLLMHGNKDRITSFEASRILGEGAEPMITFHGWDDLYHELHNEPCKDQILHFVLTWINSIITNKLTSYEA
jgi:alpha-beta hydrolase superfamily lysophospholipase